jgi:hypothetical protein
MNFGIFNFCSRAGLFVLFGIVMCTNVGCKWFGGSGSSSREPNFSKGDPLLGMRLPPQNVLGPDKSDVAKDRRDPILTSPASRERDKPTRPNENDLPPRAGMDLKSEVPPVPAALANPRKTSDELKIERKPKPIDLTTAIPGSNMGDGYEQISGTLKRLGAKWEKPSHSNDGYVMSVDVPQSRMKDSPVRRYMGVGPTPAAALRAAHEQIKSDQKPR